MSTTFRKPAQFRADDPRLITAAAEPSLPVAQEEAAVPPPAPRSRMRWAALFWASLSGIVVIALGLAVTSFVEELFARAPWLGAVGLALSLIAGLSLVALAAREVLGLLRLGTIESVRQQAAAAMASDNRAEGRAAAEAVLALTRRMPHLARARNRLQGHLSDIIDGRDLVLLTERELMAPLDAEARRLVLAAGKRVSVVTAVSPRAVVDMAFVLINALSLIRRLSLLYGGRPGTLGVLRLFRRVVSHLAVTGGVAVTDSLLQQVIGHGLAARLSARLGEGVLNGLLTARLGLLAIDLARPLPFAALPRPSLNDLAGGLLRAAEAPSGSPEPPAGSPPRA